MKTLFLTIYSKTAGQNRNGIAHNALIKFSQVERRGTRDKAKAR